MLIGVHMDEDSGSGEPPPTRLGGLHLPDLTADASQFDLRRSASVDRFSAFSEEFLPIDDLHGGVLDLPFYNDDSSQFSVDSEADPKPEERTPSLEEAPGTPTAKRASVPRGETCVVNKWLLHAYRCLRSRNSG